MPVTSIQATLEKPELPKLSGPVTAPVTEPVDFQWRLSIAPVVGAVTSPPVSLEPVLSRIAAAADGVPVYVNRNPTKKQPFVLQLLFRATVARVDVPFPQLALEFVSVALAVRLTVPRLV